MGSNQRVVTWSSAPGISYTLITTDCICSRVMKIQEIILLIIWSWWFYDLWLDFYGVLWCVFYGLSSGCHNFCTIIGLYIHDDGVSILEESKTGRKVTYPCAESQMSLQARHTGVGAATTLREKETTFWISAHTAWLFGWNLTNRNIISIHAGPNLSYFEIIHNKNQLMNN